MGRADDGGEGGRRVWRVLGMSEGNAESVFLRHARLKASERDSQSAVELPQGCLLCRWFVENGQELGDLHL